MAPRAASPALSENEFDIFDNLAGSDTEEQGNSLGLGADFGINLDVGSDGGSDDEAFIAAKQAASNRKAANVKGTGKKGGGFSAMGLNALLLKAIAQKGFNGWRSGIGIERDVKRIGSTGATDKGADSDRATAEIVTHIDSGNGDVSPANALIAD